MPVGVVQVINDTSRTLNYHNTETGKKISVPPKVTKLQEDGLIPSSDYYDDTVPFQSSGHIKISLDNAPGVEISDKDWRLSFRNAVNEDPKVSLSLNFDNGDKFMLYVGEVWKERPVLFVFKFEDKCKADGGHIAVNLARQHKAIGVAAWDIV